MLRGRDSRLQISCCAFKVKLNMSQILSNHCYPVGWPNT